MIAWAVSPCAANSATASSPIRLACAADADDQPQHPEHQNDSKYYPQHIAPLENLLFFRHSIIRPVPLRSATIVPEGEV
jgi:hypothetical protein